MTWKAILKKLDYNEMSDDLKRSVIYLMLNDTNVDANVEDYFTSVSDDFGQRQMVSHLPFPRQNFRLEAHGNIQADEDGLNLDVSLYAQNEDDESEAYLLGGWFGGEDDIAEMPDFSSDLPEDMTFDEAINDLDYLSNSMVLPDFTPVTEMTPKDINRFFYGKKDYNKLVSYLKQAGEWDEDLEEDAMRSMKKDTKKVEHSPKIKQWLDEAQEFGAQQFEQSASPDDKDSIRGAKEYYDLLDYLEETDAKEWNKSKLTLKYPYAMTIVSESLDGLPTGE